MIALKSLLHRGGRWSLILVIACLTYFILLPIALRIAGYYPNGLGWEVAKEIVQHGGRAAECLNIIHPIAHPFSPSVGEQRSGCIYEYAKLTNDPSACELLLPSPYGWSCLGVAREKGDACDINYGRDVTWRENEESEPQVATLTDCRETQGMTEKGQQCCHVLRVTGEQEFNDCSLFAPGSDISELCYGLLAVKHSRIEECEHIQNANRREICRITVRYR